MSTLNDLAIEIDRTIREMDFTEPLTKCAEVIGRATAENFEQSRTPEGRAWEALKKVTLNSRVQDLQGNDGPIRSSFGIKPLLVYEALKDAASAKNPPGGIREIQGNTLTYGVDQAVIPYAGKHQRGGVSPSGRPVSQREYLGITEDMADKMEEIVLDYVVSKFGG